MAANEERSDLVRAAQAGDLASLEALIGELRPHAVRFALKTCPASEAEDAAQEALTTLFRRIGLIRSTAAVTSWLFVVVRNECLRRFGREVGTDVLLVDVPTGDRAVEDVAVDRTDLARALARLRPHERDLLIWRDLEGYSTLEVASMLRISERAVKSRVHRARRALAAELRRPGRA